MAGHQAGLHRQGHPGGPGGVDQHLFQFLRDPLGGDHRDRSRHRLDRLAGLAFDREPKPRGEPRGAEQSELVLGEPGDRVADGADDPGLDVGPTANEVEDLAAEGVEEHPVNREIPALGVVPGVGEGD